MRHALGLGSPGIVLVCWMLYCMYPPVETEPTPHLEFGVSGFDNKGLVEGALPVGRQK